MAGKGRPGPAKAPPKPCSIEGCEGRQIARGLCAKHYQRQKAHGDPTVCLRNNETPNGAARDWLRDHVGHQGEECLTWPFAVNRRGYATVAFGGSKIASRAICILAHGEPPTPDHQAAHSCGNGDQACMNPRHLRWATQHQNMADQIDHGTRAHGDSHGRRKLSSRDVEAIRHLGKTMLQKDVAAQFGISREQVGKILRGERWAA